MCVIKLTKVNYLWGDCLSDTNYHIRFVGVIFGERLYYVAIKDEQNWDEFIQNLSFRQLFFSSILKFKLQFYYTLYDWAPSALYVMKLLLEEIRTIVKNKMN